MDGFDILGDGPSPPSRLFERLAQIPGYTWDQSIKPYHSVSTQQQLLLLNTMHCTTKIGDHRVTIIGTFSGSIMALATTTIPCQCTIGRNQPPPEALKFCLQGQSYDMRKLVAVLPKTGHSLELRRRGLIPLWWRASQPIFSDLNVNTISVKFLRRARIPNTDTLYG